MFERLVLCDLALADLTGANANVFYELGVRHVTRPGATILVFAEATPPPFDLGPRQAIAYCIDANGNLARPEQDSAAIAEALRVAIHFAESKSIRLNRSWQSFWASTFAHLRYTRETTALARRAWHGHQDPSSAPVSARKFQMSRHHLPRRSRARQGVQPRHIARRIELPEPCRLLGADRPPPRHRIKIQIIPQQGE